MFTPVPMVRVELLALDRDLVSLSERIGDMALLHPVNVLQLEPWAAPLDWPEMDNLAAEFAASNHGLDRITGLLQLPDGNIPSPPTISPPEVLQEATQLLERIDPQVRALADRANDLQRRRLHLDALQAQLSMLRDLDVDLVELRDSRFLHTALGLMPPENVGRLDDSLREIPHALIPIRKVGERVLVFAFSRRQEMELHDRALDSSYVERVAIPSDLNGKPAEAMAWLLSQRAELELQVEAMERNRDSLRDRWGEALRWARAEMEANARVVGIWQKAGRTERTRLLAGWVPRAMTGRFVAQVEEATEGRALTAVTEPSPSGDLSTVGAPTALANPLPLRPFEQLTRTFGLPDYWDLDPTPLAGSLYLLMFGMMFGDVGQGVVLVAFGLALAAGRVPRGWRDLARILTGCGISATLFGALYGSIFGSEDVLPALWIRPNEEPLLLIGTAIALGVIVLGTGLVFGAITAWRRHDLLEFYFGQNGLAGLWLYCALVAVALPAAIGRGLPSVTIIAIFVAPPVAVLLLHIPAARAFGWIKNVDWGAYAVETSMEVFDLVVRFVSNTISFLRLGAFALAHASLGMTVFALAELAQGLPGAFLSIVILGNVAIIALETLVVGIQALRLEYYEFFTKFLRGAGLPYQPFALYRQGTGCG